MAKKNRRRKNNSRVVLGAGLILVGLAAFLILLGPKNTEASQPVSRSVVPMEVNYPAPELSLQNVNGETESLIDYRDKVVLVNNWATWCPPCKAEIPTLEAYYKAHNADGFVIIGIEAGESQTEVLKFVQGSKITYPIWIDLENAAMNAFHNSSLPSSYVIDRKGIVQLAWVGEISLEMLEKHITPLLTEN
jgi:cytochrome c biogenesis protein CcmG, thiol:disulfide interchange protein DsbE